MHRERRGLRRVERGERDYEERKSEITREARESKEVQGEKEEGLEGSEERGKEPKGRRESRREMETAILLGLSIDKPNWPNKCGTRPLPREVREKLGNLARRS